MKNSRIGIWFLIALLFACFLAMACGRTPSRFLGKNHRQVLKIRHLKQFISISYDWQENSTVKDVTYLADDGYVYTQEFKDVSPLEGVIRWVPAGQDESFIQTRAISRWTGTPINLQLPEDCQKILGVDVTFKNKTERTKMLTYLSKDGRIMSREYPEGFIGRHFAGWLEVKRAE